MGFKLYQEVIDHSRATGAAYQVHLNLAIRADDVTRQYRASNARIGRETRLHVRTVKFGLKDLRDLKHVTTNRKGSPKGINQFTLTAEQGAIRPPSLEKQGAIGPPPHPNKGQWDSHLDQTRGNTATQSEKKERQEKSNTQKPLPKPSVLEAPLHNVDQASPEQDYPATQTAHPNPIPVAAFPKQEKTSPPSPPSGRGGLADADFFTELRANKAYRHIDIERELGKMQAWLMTGKGRGRKITRGFVVNWLNRIDPPMNLPPRKREVVL